MFRISIRRPLAAIFRCANLLCLFLLAGLAHSQPAQVWQKFNTIPNPALNLYDTRSYTDPAGNTFQIGAIESGIGTDQLLTRYDPSGNVLWSVMFGVPNTNSSESGFFVKSDSSENAYVCEFDGGNSFGRTQKYGPTGNLIWDVPFPLPCQPAAFQVDSSGNSYMILYQEDINFSNPTTHVVKLDNAGNSLYDYSGPRDGAIFPNTALGSDGSLYFCGYFDPGNGTETAYVTKLNPNGTLGWTRTYASAGTQNVDMNSGVVVDSANNVVVYGIYGDQGINDVQGGAIQYDSAGNFQWIRRFGVNTSVQSGAIDSLDNLFVCGPKPNVSSSNDPATWKLDSSGNITWTRVFPNIGAANATSAKYVVPDGSGGVYTQVTCDSLGAGIVAYDSSGNLVWPSTGIYHQGGIFYKSSFNYTLCDGFSIDAAGDFYLGGGTFTPGVPRKNFAVKFSVHPQVSTITFSPTAVTNNAATAGTVTLNMPAGAGGVTVTLTGSTAATVPASVVVPVGQTTTTFAATGHNTFYNPVLGTVTGVAGSGSTVNGSFTVYPPNGGSFISQNTPTAMTSGQHYLVTLQYKNNGALTWDVAHQYRLQSRNAANNTTWGSNRMTLINAPVAPGGTGIFTINALAPATAGTYNFQWIPIEDSVAIAFGALSPNVAVVVTKAADAAQFVSNTGATTLFAGTDFFSTNTMKNVGTNTWTTAALYSMMSQSPANNTTWNGNRIPIPAGVPSVAPGASVTFTKQCTAPITPGTYTMQWQCDKNGVAFGDTTPLLTMTVVQGPDNSQWLSTTGVPTSIGPSKTFTGVISMKNLGTATWTAGPYTLVPVGTNNFGIASVAAVSTAQNATDAFSALFTAPATPGTYTFQWRVAHSGTKFGQSSPSITIVVSADAAQYVSRTGATTVNAGADFFSTYTMKNTGTTTWTSAAGYFLSLIPAASTTWTANRINLPATVAPGASFTNSALCTAPIVPGTYTQQWQMSKSGVLFGGTTPLQNIIVVNGADNAQFVSQVNVPTTIVHGTTFTATITMKNIGTGGWAAGTHSLTSVGTNNFGVASIPAGTVAPGANGTFSTLFTAPVVPGTYTFKWRMQHTATKFGQPTASITITVT